jgi:hypothetical protein
MDKKFCKLDYSFNCCIHSINVVGCPIGIRGGREKMGLGTIILTPLYHLDNSNNMHVYHHHCAVNQFL